MSSGSSVQVSVNPVYLSAVAALGSGLSLIPIQADGSKGPAARLLPRTADPATGEARSTWKPYQERQPTWQELATWFPPGAISYPDCGIGIVCGEVSGGLEVIDFDELCLFHEWWKRLAPTFSRLLQQLVIVQTPRPGAHVYIRSAECGPNRPLARKFEIGSNGKPKKKVRIEVKGEGGMAIAPGSPPGCHPSFKTYEFVTLARFNRIPFLTADERRVLMSAAQEFDQLPPQTAVERVVESRRTTATGDRLGDRLMQPVSWSTILEPHGWQLIRMSGEISHWRRPGKSEGTSATINFAGNDLLHVFSENAHPFEAGRNYSKFVAYALLNHQSDFRAALRALTGIGPRHRALRRNPHNGRRRRRP